MNGELKNAFYNSFKSENGGAGNVKLIEQPKLKSKMTFLFQRRYATAFISERSSSRGERRVIERLTAVHM